MVNKSLASSLFSMSYNKTGEIQKKSADKSFSMFNNILSETVDRNSNVGTNKKTTFANNAKKGSAYKQIDSSYQTESKREAIKSENTNNSKELKSSKKHEPLNKDEEEKLIKKCLAENLGISVCDLELLLDKFNIDVMDIEGNLEAFNGLKEFLGLSLSEEKTLLKVIELVKEEVQKSEAFIKEDLETNKDKENWIKIQGFEVEVEESTQNTEMEELSVKVKKNLEQLSNKNAENLPKEISENVEKVIENSAEFTIGKSEATIKEDEILDGRSNKNYVESKKETIHQRNSDRNEESEMEGQLFSQKSEELEEKPKDMSQMEFRSLFSENLKTFNQVKESAINQKTEVVAKKEVAFQIVEKAKVLLTGEKSEMIMDLKPDHLGKLSLKLVTERGLVIAKFVAENEQVRAAIEANMDTLKESLEKQGFSIQEFSVSVNHNKNRHQGENGENSNNLRKSGTKGKGILSGNAIGTDVEMEISKNNPYILSDSSINLTA